MQLWLKYGHNNIRTHPFVSLQRSLPVGKFLPSPKTLLDHLRSRTFNLNRDLELQGLPCSTSPLHHPLTALIWIFFSNFLSPSFSVALSQLQSQQYCIKFRYLPFLIELFTVVVGFRVQSHKGRFWITRDGEEGMFRLHWMKNAKLTIENRVNFECKAVSMSFVERERDWWSLNFLTLYECIDIM